MKSATVVVNRTALKHNLERLRELAPSSKIIAIVKANAYGHGILEIARTLIDADAFGVARLEEAVLLAKGGITQNILVLEGFFDSAELPIFLRYQIHTAVHSLEQLRALELAELTEPINVWLIIDTGMHRLGVRPEEAEAFYQRLMRCKNVRQPIIIFSHFSSADEPEKGVTEKQLDIFNTFTADKLEKRSIAASSGILLWPESHFDWIRPGIILYGVSPLRETCGFEFGFKPVMTLTTSLIAIRKHKAGEVVGYNGIWVSERDTYIGVIAIGYGDGYPRDAPSGTPVLINDREVAIVGRVSMDMICVDLGPKLQDKIGDLVIVWGENLPVERIADIMNVSVYELITRLTVRPKIIYVD